MIRRIFTAALGGIAGVALVYSGLAALHATWLLLFARLWPIWVLIAVGCGGFAMWVGEKFKIVPSTEEINRKLGPVSLFDQRASNSEQEASAGTESQRVNSGTRVIGEGANGDYFLELMLTPDEARLGIQKLISFSSKKLRLNVPAAVTTGTRLRLAGQAPTTGNSGKPGDLYVSILVNGPVCATAPGQDPDGNFFLQLPLTFDEALVGAAKLLPFSGKEIKINVPAGVESGTRLRLPGIVAPAAGKSGKPGDLYVVILVHNHPIYQRNQNDLFCTLRVTDAILRDGSEVDLPALSGRKVATVKIPPGTQPGTRLQVAGRGVPRVSSPMAAGNLYVTVESEEIHPSFSTMTA